jgi:tRNA(Ile)-lysidine synthase
MRISFIPGSYVVAVSGGVDSVVLLSILAEQVDSMFIVAHFDHGMRLDSARDRKFVESLADSYDLPFIYERAELGRGASEATARVARYRFLESVRKQRAAQAIMTAHHQDDALETAIINLVRGTGRKGLTALSSNDRLVRPLLAYPKTEILAYARLHHLSWREDSTNIDRTYRRNYVRHNIIPRLGQKGRDRLVEIIAAERIVNNAIDSLLSDLLKPTPDKLNRRLYAQLSHAVAKELMAEWLRGQGVNDFDKATIERLVIQAKTLAVGKRIAVRNNRYISVGKDDLALTTMER